MSYGARKVSIDGKTSGTFLDSDDCKEAVDIYFDIHKALNLKAFACGRKTFDFDFTKGYQPDLSKYASVQIEKVDYVANDKATSYAVAYDRKGKLGWKNGVLESEEFPFFNGANIIEVLTKEVSDAYLAYLKDIGISYIFADTINESLVKLKKLFGIDTLLLEGGSIINAAFAKEKLIDEISLVQCSMVVGPTGNPLFDDALLETFVLNGVEQKGNNLVIKYKKK